MKKISKKYIKSVLPVPIDNMDKYDAGAVMIFAGAGGMAGAAMMSGYSAMRAGAGLVRIVTSKEAFVPIQSLLQEVILMDIEDSSTDSWKRKANIERVNSHMKAIAFGPGMGNSGDTKKYLEMVLRSYELPLIIDADGLNVLAQSMTLKKLVREYPEAVIITPHENEAKRLLGLPHHEGIAANSRQEIAEALASEYDAITVLKGKDTLVAAPGGTLVNPTGNPAMATAGSGDILTGIITAFMGRGIPAPDAALAGVYIHGLAGDKARGKKGTYGTMARDIIKKIPDAISEFVK